MMRLAVGVLVLGLLVRCGVMTSSDEPVGPGSNVTYQVHIFSAPWCENCETYIPALHSKIEESLRTKSQRLSATLYVESGKKQWDKPTPEVVASYSQKMNLPAFEFSADPWKNKIYLSYYPDKPNVDIPAVVVIGSDGSRKIYKPGASLDEVVAYIEAVTR